MTVTHRPGRELLGDSDLSHDVTFEADAATVELTITASQFSFTPSTTGDLTATVSGDGIDGGSETVAIISTSEPPITISYDMSEYTFAENSTDAAVYLVATLDAAYPRGPSRSYFMTFSTTPGRPRIPKTTPRYLSGIHSLAANTDVTPTPTRSWPASSYQTSASLSWTTPSTRARNGSA